MTEAITAYPLAWPVGWERTPWEVRRPGRFGKQKSHRSSFSDHTYYSKGRLSIADGTTRVLATLERMGVDTVDDVVISSDLKLRLDGLPRSSQREPEDPGVCVYWVTAAGDRRCMAIDRYDKIADNLAAIAATLEAMRSIERHGGAEILDRAFTGFTALPAPADEPWWSVLDYQSESDALASEFEKRARKRLSMVHADTGTGDDWMFNKIKKALDEGRRIRDGREQ